MALVSIGSIDDFPDGTPTFAVMVVAFFRSATGPRVVGPVGENRMTGGVLCTATSSNGWRM